MRPWRPESFCFSSEPCGAAIPAAASSDQLIAFDTGPGNMVMDALSERLFDKTFDSGGRLAARGRVMEAVVKEFLSGPFFRRRPPRTAGREEFGREFAENFLAPRLRSLQPDQITLC